MGIHAMVAFFQKGGLFMYPILFVFAAGMAIALERWFRLGRIQSVNRRMWNTLHPMLVKGEFDKVRAVVNKDKSTISQMLGMGLAKVVSPGCGPDEPNPAKNMPEGLILCFSAA